MPTGKRWNIDPPHPQAEELASRLRTSPLIAQMLLNRGIDTAESAQQFLRPNLAALADPDSLPGLPAAAQRIAQAIRDREKIVVYGDYDVDGITATTILWHAITLLGGIVHTYIPHRVDEGYGLSTDALQTILDAGAKLVVTVDCGITAIEPAMIAKQRGIDLIITDHHQWHGDPPQLPDCFAIVHPRLPGEKPYANPHLCGAGVAFKLAWGIGKAVSGSAKVPQPFRNFLLEATALAALGTIADVVPLVGENRVLAHFGLGGLKESPHIGLRALIASAALTGQKLDSYHVGFLLAPRLNACGRMGHAALAVEMLTTATAERAQEIAVYLEEQNRARQAVEKTILTQALAQIESSDWADDQHRALVLAGEGWHPGVIGIVASRIVDRFCRPTIMIALPQPNTPGIGQGSGRSVPGFHLARALERCHQHLLAHGGHEMAAGLKIEPANVPDFRAAFLHQAAADVTDQMLIPELRLECDAQLPQITEPLVTELRRLGPFGHGNRKPLLCIKNVTLTAAPRRVGKTGEHVQMQVRGPTGTPMKCIAFGFGNLADELAAGALVNLAVEPSINEFNGRTNVELQIKDLQVETSSL